MRSAGLEPAGTHHMVWEHNPAGMWMALLTRMGMAPGLPFHLLKRNARARPRDVALLAVGVPLAPVAVVAEALAAAAGRGRHGGDDGAARIVRADRVFTRRCPRADRGRSHSLALLGALCVAAPAQGASTLERTIAVQPGTGFRALVPAPRRALAAARAAPGMRAVPRRAQRRRSLFYFAQLSDLQLVDETSPSRKEYLTSIAGRQLPRPGGAHRARAARRSCAR